MKKFYALFVMFALAVGANAQVKMTLSPSEAQALQVGTLLRGQYEVLGIYAKPQTQSRVKKAGDDNFVPFGVGTGVYHRDEHPLAQGEEYVYELNCNILYQPSAEDDYEYDFVIEEFFRYATVDTLTGDTTRTNTDLYFYVDEDNQVYVPVNDLGIFIKVHNRTTGEEFDVECYCSDVATGLGKEEYRAYYPCTADLTFGLFNFNMYYFCDAGGFGVAEEYFKMDGTEEIWTDWQPLGIAEYCEPVWWPEYDEDTEELIDSGIQTDIEVWQKIYNPNPKISQLWFKGWGAGYFTKTGVDIFMDVDFSAGDTATLSIEMQNTGGAYVDETGSLGEVDAEYPLILVTLPQFNSEVWPAATCGSQCWVDEVEETMTGVIYPFICFCTDESQGSYNGWYPIDPSGEVVSRDAAEWWDWFVIDTSEAAKEQVGIENVNRKAEIKTQMSSIYNLAGARVDKNYKGIIIVGGKKYLNK